MTFSFWVFYLLALLPLAAGGLLLIFDKEVNWIEWAIGSAVALILAGIFHATSIHGMTDDIETWSGQLTQARHYARWQEYYEEAIYRTETYTTMETDSKGNTHIEFHTRQVFDHWESRNRWHNDYWHTWSNIDTSYEIDKSFFEVLCKRFNDHHSVPGDRRTGEHNSRMIGGDPNDYVSNNKTGWVQPVTDHRHFENRIKAAPSVFSFAPIPKDVKVYPYPVNDNPWQSDRLIGSAVLLNALAFDQMNSRLGPSKKVNVIMVGAGSKDSMFSQWQEAAYLRGRKNDIVIVWGGANTHPTWCRVFSWGEGRALKEIETLILDKGVSDAILPEIEGYIRADFTRADWKKWSYLNIEISASYVWWYLGIMIVTQGLFYWFARTNAYSKIGDALSRRPSYGSNYRSYRRL